MAPCTVLAQYHPVLDEWFITKKFTLKVTRKVKTCRQTKEEAGDARSDNETVARGTQDGRFTENLVNISLTLALV